MARKSLQDVQSLANTYFADNNSGAITPQLLREWCAAIIGAIRPAYAYLNRIGPTSQTPPVGAPAALVFDFGTLSPIVDYSTIPVPVDPPTGTPNPQPGQITRLEKGTVRITFTADVAPTANANNTVTFTLFKNGVATAWKQSVMLTATGVVESVSLAALEYLNAAATYEIRVSATVATAMNFSNLVFLAETVPVWEYI